MFVAGIGVLLRRVRREYGRVTAKSRALASAFG